MNEDLFLLFILPLNRARIRYMVTGSAAVTVYGEPRLTHDVDLVIALPQAEIGVLKECYPKKTFYSPPEEIILEEVRRSVGGSFNVVHSATGFKADFYLAQEDLHRWGMERRTTVDVGGEQVWIAPPEYVIVRKLMAFREGGSEKHLRDISGILRLSSESVDRDVLAGFVGEMGLETEWERVACAAG